MRTAPDTDEKDNMITTEADSIQYRAECEDLIEEATASKSANRRYYEDIVVWKWLHMDLESVVASDCGWTSNEHDREFKLEVSHRHSRQIMKSLGYQKRRLNVGNKSRRVWIKPGISNSEIREFLSHVDKRPDTSPEFSLIKGDV